MRVNPLAFNSLRPVRRFISASFAGQHNTSSSIGSKPVHRTANTRRSPVEYMGINHRRLDVVMAQEFLHRADIVASFEQVSGKRVPAA